MEHDSRTLTLRRAIVLVVVFGLLAPALLISGYSWFRQYNEGIEQQTRELLQQNADIVANGMQEPLWNINEESGSALLEAMMSRSEDIVRIEVRDNALGLFVAGERPERRSGFSAVTEKPVNYRGTPIGSVKVEVSSARLRESMAADLLESMLAVLAQAVLSIILILILLERRLVRPLQRLGAGAERLAAGQLDMPFSWMRLDEIGLLARRMEDTRVSLRRLFEDQRRIEHEIRELNANLEHRVAQRTAELQHANKELAHALNTLNLAQEELVRSEKLAALGSLVAGIAHELNTPIGNSLMVASTLSDETHALADAFRNSGLRRSALEQHFEDAGKAGDILLRNLHRAANLINGFKQVAVDQTSSQRRRFSLAAVVSEIVLTLSPTFRKTGFSVNQQIPDALMMDSYPGPLGQVIANLVNNALLHGFEGRQSGAVTIAAEADGAGWIELSVGDDGVGIPAANLSRLFDPFFTTKLGAGGSGLGLNIVHNIVTGVLGGRIRVQSEPGAGSVFVLSLPPVAPHKQSEDADEQRAPVLAAGVAVQASDSASAIPLR